MPFPPLYVRNPYEDDECCAPAPQWKGEKYGPLSTMSSNLTDLAYLAGQRGATQPKTLAYVIDVNFEVKKQIGVPYRHAQIAGRLIDALQLRLKRIELRCGKVRLHARLDNPEPLVQSAHAVANDPAGQLGRNI